MLAPLLAVALELGAEVPRGGAVAAASVRDGTIVSVEVHGAPPDAVFRVASLSKVVTTLAVLQLVEEGRIDLRADVGGYLGGLPLERHHGMPVTMHHLLTHTSGIDDAFFGNVVRLGGRVPSLEEHFRARPAAFGRAPGAQVYSNEGMALAGLVVERVTRLPFAEHVRRRIFEPLGMRSSSFEQPPPFAGVPSGAEGEALVQAPSGAMVSTAGDMARLMLALLGDSPEAVRLRRPYGMFQDGIGGKRGLFHTGRSGHESVLYLVPGDHLGVFLVHTGGVDPTLRRRYVQSILGSAQERPPGAPRVRDGTYRPLLFPVHRIERVAEVGADASVTSEGGRVTLRLPPFAHGRSLEFLDGTTRDGYRMTGSDGRFVVTGPLFDPVTFVRLPWWRTGTIQAVAFAAALLTVLGAVVRARGAARWTFLAFVALLLAAPMAFLAGYVPGDPTTRPFRVAGSLRAAATMLLLAAAVGAVTPVVAWRARVARLHCVLAALAALGIVLLLHPWNLLGYRW